LSVCSRSSWPPEMLAAPLVSHSSDRAPGEVAPGEHELV
jgi:hypothetical protein